MLKSLRERSFDVSVRFRTYSVREIHAGQITGSSRFYLGSRMAYIFVCPQHLRLQVVVDFGSKGFFKPQKSLETLKRSLIGERRQITLAELRPFAEKFTKCLRPYIKTTTKKDTLRKSHFFSLYIIVNK